MSSQPSQNGLKSNCKRDDHQLAKRSLTFYSLNFSLPRHKKAAQIAEPTPKLRKFAQQLDAPQMKTRNFGLLTLNAALSDLERAPFAPHIPRLTAQLVDSILFAADRGEETLLCRLRRTERLAAAAVRIVIVVVLVFIAVAEIVF